MRSNLLIRRSGNLSKHTQWFIKASTLLFFLLCSTLLSIENVFAADNTNRHAHDHILPGPVLTVENNIYTVFDTHQQEHAFRRQSDGRYGALNSSSGTLEQTTRNGFQWTDNTGNNFRFSGSVLLPAQRSAAVSSTAHSTAEVNSGISSTMEECTPLESSPATDNQPIEETDEPEQCDTEATGPHTFSRIDYGGSLTILDARPESCESYFVEYYGTTRGFEIEAGLEQHPPYNNMQATVRNFPVIDFFDDSRMVVVHSRDLGNRTFNSPTRPDALLEQLLEDGEQIQTRFVDVLHEQGSISANERGQTTTISEDQLRPITLQIVIRDGIASADHWRQIAEAREKLMRLYGITLEVVVIP